MFTNLINKYDFYKIYELIVTGKILNFLNKYIKGPGYIVKNRWVTKEHIPQSWWDIPLVKERWNILITGKRNKTYFEYVTEKYLKKYNLPEALSLGCGDGRRELEWIKLIKFKKLDAYDISEKNIEKAKNRIKSDNISFINYEVKDMNNFDFNKKYDIIFCEQSLHHFKDTDKILRKIKNSLHEKGILIVNEFIGPTRFQWTDRQIEIINGILKIFPKKYRDTGKRIKNFVFKPSYLRMYLGDPSEAVDSGNILENIKKYFDIIEMKEYGGTILNLLFSEIAHNFIDNTSETNELLKVCFSIEDIMLSMNEIKSDFALIVSKPNDKR